MYVIPQRIHNARRIEAWNYQVSMLKFNERGRLKVQGNLGLDSFLLSSLAIYPINIARNIS
jgi:hypothetical protein